MASSVRTGVAALAVIGLASFAIALVGAIARLADGTLLSYAPMAQLQVLILVLLLVPSAALIPRLRRALTDLEEIPEPRLRRLGYFIVNHWLPAFAAVVGVAPGLFLLDSEQAVPLFAGILVLGYLALRGLAGPRRARLKVWVALSTFAIVPTVSNLVFSMLF